MATEQEVLEKIAENNNKAHIQFIAKQMRISSDYARFICADLARKGLLEQAPGRDCYQIIKKTKKKIRQRPKDNPGKDNPGEREKMLSLGQIIDKGITKIKVELKNKIKLIIAKTWKK